MENTFIKVAERGDYKTAYEDFMEFERGFDEEFRHELTFEEFMTEFNLGYGNSSHPQVARLVETIDGIWYDNEYC